MVACRRVDDIVTCGLTACTPGSAPGPTPVARVENLYFYLFLGEPLRISGVAFLGLDALYVSQSAVSKHWIKLQGSDPNNDDSTVLRLAAFMSASSAITTTSSSNFVTARLFWHLVGHTQGRADPGVEIGGGHMASASL